MPFVPHGWLIFPEMPGALIVAWAALWLWQPIADRDHAWILARRRAGAASVAAHEVRDLPGDLLAALLWSSGARGDRSRRSERRSRSRVAAWLSFFYAFYGELNPEAPYGDYTRDCTCSRRTFRAGCWG